MDQIMKDNQVLHTELQAQRSLMDEKQQASNTRMTELEGVIAQMAQQGKQNSIELVNMGGQITAVFSQLNTLQNMLTQALGQQQQQQQPPQQQQQPPQQQQQQWQGGQSTTPSPPVFDPAQQHPNGAGTEQHSYGKGDSKGSGKAPGLNHNLY